MVANKKHLSPAKEWLEEIEKAMQARDYATVIDYIDDGTHFESVLEDDNFCYVTKKIWWRILNAAKRRTLDLHDRDGGKHIMEILAKEHMRLPLNNKQKRIAAEFIKKYDIPTFASITNFLATKNNPDFDDRSPYLNNKDKERDFRELLQNKDKNNAVPLFSYAEDMLKFYRDLPPHHSDLIHFSSLYKNLQHSSNKQGVQVSLFAEPTDSKFIETIDKKSFLRLAALYGRVLTDNSYSNQMFMDKFSSFMFAVVRKNSFSREEVKKLASAIKRQPWKSEKIETHLMNLGNNLVNIYDKKQELQVKALTEWFLKKQNDKSTDKDVLLQTYVSQLTIRLVDDTDINTTKFDVEYNNQKRQFKSKIFEEKNEGIRTKETADKVRKAYVAETKRQIINLNLTLDGAYSNKKRMVKNIRKNLPSGFPPPSNTGNVR